MGRMLAVQHTVMARPAFHGAWTRIVPRPKYPTGARR